jgi:hypothetical protein
LVLPSAWWFIGDKRRIVAENILNVTEKESVCRKECGSIDKFGLEGFISGVRYEFGLVDASGRKRDAKVFE